MPIFIADTRAPHSECWPIEGRLHDGLTGPVGAAFDGVHSLDVLEHVRPPTRIDSWTTWVASLAAQAP